MANSFGFFGQGNRCNRPQRQTINTLKSCFRMNLQRTDKILQNTRPYIKPGHRQSDEQLMSAVDTLQQLVTAVRWDLINNVICTINLCRTSAHVELLLCFTELQETLARSKTCRERPNAGRRLSYQGTRFITGLKVCSQTRIPEAAILAARHETKLLVDTNGESSVIGSRPPAACKSSLSQGGRQSSSWCLNLKCLWSFYDISDSA